MTKRNIEDRGVWGCSYVRDTPSLKTGKSSHRPCNIRKLLRTIYLLIYPNRHNGVLLFLSYTTIRASPSIGVENR